MFQKLTVGAHYSRPKLADLWGYAGYQAQARGVVTPVGTPYIIIFVTQDKQSSAEQYNDRLVGNMLIWEGPNDHFAEGRMLRADQTGDQIHVFYRAVHHSDFVYKGRAKVGACQKSVHSPSRFQLELID